MSTKRTATPQPGSSSSSSTPIGGVGGAGGGSSAAGSRRMQTPLSPTRQLRLQEKAELQGLNDRLASYIDRVRSLEAENMVLNLEVRSREETVTREVSNIKAVYEQELNEARRLLDETSREKAKLEIDTKRLFEERNDFLASLQKKTKELANAENNARILEARINELTQKYNSAAAEAEKRAIKLEELEREHARVKAQLEEVRKSLEYETLTRVDLENNLQTLREELAFKNEIYSQELNESRSRRTVDTSEIDGRINQEYEAQMQRTLEELREEYDTRMRANREEVEQVYAAKMAAANTAAQRNALAAANSVEESRQLRARIEPLNKRISELEQQHNQLLSKVRTLEQQLDDERSRYNRDFADFNNELLQARNELANQAQEYKDLMDIKVSLDMEIATYEKLLNGEETRLNLSQQKSSSSSFSTRVKATPSRSTGGGIKRKRTMLDDTEELSQAEFTETKHAKGDVHVSEVDAEGKFIKISNKGNTEAHLGGWQLLRIVDKKTKTQYKFSRTFKLEAGASVCIWSNDAGVEPSPPNTLVMKSQKWAIGDDTKTVLNNADGDEMAAQERIKHIIKRHVTRHRSTVRGSGRDSTVVDGHEQAYHQQTATKKHKPSAAGSSQQTTDDERCTLM